MLAINVIRPAWRREFAITCVAEMGLLFAYLVSLITTVAVSAVVLSAIGLVHGLKYTSQLAVHLTGQVYKHDARLRIARSILGSCAFGQCAYCIAYSAYPVIASRVLHGCAAIGG
jgi:hypothetical protein